MEAAAQIETVVPDSDGRKEAVANKGYHSNEVLVDLEAVGVRSYISEPDRVRRKWKDNPDARHAVYRNLQRIRGAHGKRLLRQRGEFLERPFAHLYEGMRRVHLRRHHNILKRVRCTLVPWVVDARAVRRGHAAGSQGPRCSIS